MVRFVAIDNFLKVSKVCILQIFKSPKKCVYGNLTQLKKLDAEISLKFETSKTNTHCRIKFNKNKKLVMFNNDLKMETTKKYTLIS